MRGDFGFFLGLAAIILAIAWAVYIGKAQERLCIEKQGVWKNDTCIFKERQ